MPVSPARLAANRANARKSTGPKTAEGKARSRRNGVTHGLRCESVVPPEDRERMDTQLAAWGDQLRPNGLVERCLVACAAAAVGGGGGFVAFCAKKAGAHTATARMESEAARVKRRTTTRRRRVRV